MITDRMKRKMTDKEIRWRDILEQDRDLYRQSAARQWAEWLEYGSVEVLTPEASRRVME